LYELYERLNKITTTLNVWYATLLGSELFTGGMEDNSGTMISSNGPVDRLSPSLDGGVMEFTLW